MIDMEPTGLKISARLANKPRQVYGLFAKFSLALIGACEVAKNFQIFLTRANQHIQEISRHFYGTLNNFGPMVFALNQEKIESYTFEDMLYQPQKSYFILSTIKEVEAHEAESHWTPMKNIEVNNMHKNIDGKLKTVLCLWYFKRKRFPDGILTKQKTRICAHGGMQQWGVNYCKNYAPVANLVNMI